jgi:hypothetical protein
MPQIGACLIDTCFVMATISSKRTEEASWFWTNKEGLQSKNVSRDNLQPEGIKVPGSTGAK